MSIVDPDGSPDPTTPTETPVPAVETPPAAPVAAHEAQGEDDLSPADLVDADKATGLIGAVKALRAENKELKGRGAETEHLRQQVAQLQGALQTFQHLQQTLQRQQPQAPQDTSADPELVELAQSLDYYDQQGKPDTGRAAKHAQIIQRQAQRIAQQMVQPLQQQTYQQVSAANFQRALSVKAPDGRTPSQDTLALMWQNLPPELTADPRTATVLGYLGLGMDVAEGKGGNRLPAQPPPPANPPLHTEASGGTIRPRSAPISDVSRGVMANRGMTDQKYQELTKNYRPGRAIQLEDD